MRKFLFLTLCLFCVIQNTSSQTSYGVTTSFNNGNPNGITFNESTTTGWTQITGLAGALAANVWSDAVTLPFAFNFFNTPVTQFKVSANGLLTFDASVTGTPPNGNVSLPDASLPDNTIAAFSDEFTNTQPTGTNDLVYYQTIGTAPNRQYLVYWFSFEYGNPFTSFQYNAILLEETTNKIHIIDVYGTATPGFTTTVGLQKDASTAVQFGNTVPLAGSANSNTAADNDYYTFTPGDPCNGVPVVGATVATNSTPCFGASTLLSLSGYTNEPNHSFQWESSVDNSNWSPVSGATQSNYNVTITAPTYYRCIITCTNTSQSTNSTSILITNYIAPIPYSQNFAAYPATAGSQVDCWYESAGRIPTSGNTVFSSTTASTWSVDGFANNGTTGAARVNITGTATDEWIISPPFNLNGNQQLEFDIAMTASGATTATALGADDSLCVVISTDNGATWTAANILRTWKTGDAISSTGERVIISLASYTGLVRIGFYAASSVTNATPDVFIDNFLVQDVPSCSQPNLVVLSAITQTSATISWTAPTTAPVSYDWKVVASGAGSGGTPVVSGNVAHPTTSANATGLTVGTGYDVFVRSNCGGSGNSIWVGPTALRTLPANDEPIGAFAITVGNAQTLNTEGATQTLAGCIGTSDDDVWYTFTPPSSGTYTIAFASLTGATDQAYQIFDGNPLTTGVSLGCFDGPAAGGNFDNWDASKTYYIRVYSFSPLTTLRITGGTMTITAFTGTTPPTNNDCGGATSITVSANGSCSYTALTSVNATYSLAPNICITAVNPPLNDDDIWVSFTTTNVGAYNFKSTLTSTFGLQLFSGSCGSLTPVSPGCIISFTGNVGTSFNLLAGTNYYARIWTQGSSTAGAAFDLCIEAPLPSTVFTGTGNWADPTKWSSGVPDCSGNSIDAIIASGAVCTLDVNGSSKSLIVQTGATLNISGSNELTVGCTANNNLFALEGTLNVSGGKLIVNGNFRGVASTSQIIQSGGEIIVDGNDNGNLATSAANHIFDFIATNATSLQLTGGKITIVDPCAVATTTARAFKLYPSLQVPVPSTHTVQLGNGTSVDPGGYATGGFAIELVNGSNYVTLGNLIANGSTGTNRHVNTFGTIGINGTLTVNPSSEYRIATTNYLAGNIVNDGTLTTSSVLRLESFATGAATPVTTAQTITGSGVWRNGTSATPSANMGSLTVNNTSGTPIVLPPNMISGTGTGTLSSTLTLTAGLLDCGTTPFTLGISATSGGTFSTTPVANSYIIGEFRRWVTTAVATRYFPIGTATTPRFGQINFTTAQTTGGLVSMKFNNNEALPPVGTGGIPAEAGNNNIPIDIISPTGSWTVERISGAGGVYNAIFDATNFLRNDLTPINVPDYPQLALIKRATNDAWVAGADGTAQTITNLNTISRNGCTAFSVFALGGTHLALPVTISSIRGEVTGTTNTVYWTTATEANNRKFVVERSTNGSNFIAIGDVVTRAINGNSSAVLQYNFVDVNPVQGKTFYRLQMVDNGGRVSYSQIVTLRRGAGKLEIVDVRPNPTTGNLYFNLLGVNNNSQFTLTLRTLDGKTVMVKNNFTPLGASVIDMSKLTNGMYILEALDVHNNEKVILKVMKQ